MADPKTMLSDIHRGMGELNGKFDVLREEIDRHHTSIYGNGHSGLLTRVTLAEKKIETLSVPEADAKSARSSAVTAGIAAIVTAVLGALGTFFGWKGQP